MSNDIEITTESCVSLSKTDSVPVELCVVLDKLYDYINQSKDKIDFTQLEKLLDELCKLEVILTSCVVIHLNQYRNCINHLSDFKSSYNVIITLLTIQWPFLTHTKIFDIKNEKIKGVIIKQFKIDQINWPSVNVKTKFNFTTKYKNTNDSDIT